MTDRITALTVILDPNIREDDAQPLIDAISLLQGVHSVKKHVRDASAEYFGRERLRTELWKKIHDVIYPPEGK